MTIGWSDGIDAYMAESGGACELRVHTTQLDDAAAALEAFRRGVLAIPHPDEPDEPMPNHVSTVQRDEQSAWVTIDAKDELAASPPMRARVRDLLETELTARVETAVISPPTAWVPPSMRFAQAMPSTVSPVLRDLAFALVHATSEEREALGSPDGRWWATDSPLLTDTANDELDRIRRRQVLDWYLREIVPLTLERAGFPDIAASIAGLPPVDAAFAPSDAFEALVAALEVVPLPPRPVPARGDDMPELLEYDLFRVLDDLGGVPARCVLSWTEASSRADMIAKGQSRLSAAWASAYTSGAWNVIGTAWWAAERRLGASLGMASDPLEWASVLAADVVGLVRADLASEANDGRDVLATFEAHSDDLRAAVDAHDDRFRMLLAEELDHALPGLSGRMVLGTIASFAREACRRATCVLYARDGAGAVTEHSIDVRLRLAAFGEQLIAP